MFSYIVWVIEPQEIDHKGRKLWNICQVYNLCGKEFYKKVPIFASIPIVLNDKDVRSYVSGLAEFCMNEHFKFDCTKVIKKKWFALDKMKE